MRYFPLVLLIGLSVTMGQVSGNVQISGNVTLIGNIAAGCYSNTVINFDTGVDGNPVALADLTNSTHGPSSGWTAVRLSDIAFDAAAQKTSAPNNVCGVGSVSGNGPVGIRCGTTNACAGTIFSFSSPIATAFVWIKSTVTPSSVVYIDAFSIDQDLNGGGNDYANVDIESGPGSLFRFGLETKAGHPLTAASYATNVWWGISVLYDATGSHKLRIYDSNLVFMEEISPNGHGVLASNVNRVIIGISNQGQSTPGQYVLYDNAIIDFQTARWPLLP